MIGGRISISFLNRQRTLNDCSCRKLSEMVCHGVSNAPYRLILLRPCPESSIAGEIASIRLRHPRTPLLTIFCGEWAGLEAAVKCLSDGLDDFLCCPFEPVEAEARIARLLASQPRRGIRDIVVPDFMVGSSEVFLDALGKLRSMAESDLNLLLEGETGTGKELFARAVHYMSPRKSMPFVPVNCAGLPENLLENELFGHARGAYTDATSSEPGLLKEAEGGTVFLDEIDALALSSQAKVLRFLQNREYRPLGSARTFVADVRIVAATNADLAEHVREKRFRADLLYRLNVLALRVPPLRERASDVPELAQFFLERSRPRSKTGAIGFSRLAMERMVAYSWPGNIRELESLVMRATVLSQGPMINAYEIDLPATGEDPGCPSLTQAKRKLTGEFERAYLKNLLVVHKGNISKAAKDAGKERRAFQRLVRKHNLDRGAFA